MSEGARRALAPAGVAALLLLLLAGGVWAKAVGPLGPPLPASLHAPARPRSAPSGRPTCAPGPAQLSEMESTDGFLRVRPQPSAHWSEFTFARGIYSEDGGGGGLAAFGRRDGFRRGGDFLGDGGPAWSIDYPMADRHMMLVATRLSLLDACEWGRPVSFADPELRRFPFVYSLEWGHASLSEAEVQGLRSYLMAGGLLMIDDFWGSYEWETFAREMRRVLPNHPIVEIPRDHVFFRIYYDIDGDIIQVPGAGNGYAISQGIPGARTWEQDGVTPHLRGILDANGRLMVVIHFNTDLGDALEHADDPYYPLEYSRFASELFLNTIVYALSY